MSDVAWEFAKLIGRDGFRPATALKERPHPLNGIEAACPLALMQGHLHRCRDETAPFLGRVVQPSIRSTH